MSGMPNAVWRIIAGGGWTLICLLCAALSAQWPSGIGIVVAIVALAATGLAVGLPASPMPAVVSGGLALWWVTLLPAPLLMTLVVAWGLLVSYVASAWAASLPVTGVTSSAALARIARNVLMLGGLTAVAAALAAAAMLHDPKAVDAGFWMLLGFAMLAGVAAWLTPRGRE